LAAKRRKKRKMKSPAFLNSFFGNYSVSLIGPTKTQWFILLPFFALFALWFAHLCGKTFFLFWLKTTPTLQLLTTAPAGRVIFG